MHSHEKWNVKERGVRTMCPAHSDQITKDTWWLPFALELKFINGSHIRKRTRRPVQTPLLIGANQVSSRTCRGRGKSADPRG